MLTLHVPDASSDEPPIADQLDTRISLVAEQASDVDGSHVDAGVDVVGLFPPSSDSHAGSPLGYLAFVYPISSMALCLIPSLRTRGALSLSSCMPRFHLQEDADESIYFACVKESIIEVER